MLRSRDSTIIALMDEPDISEWFWDHWEECRDQATQSGWDSLSRRDQVVLAVGFLFDSCIGDGVWAIVDGVVDGNDEGLTVKMPDALSEIGLEEAAEHIRQIIFLRVQSDSPDKNRPQALKH